jgi:hypothetical protein
MTIPKIVASVVLVAFDFQNLLAWWHGKLVIAGEQASWDFTIVIPLFGHPRYLDGREAIAQYRENVLVALEVTPPVMEAFADKLEAEGWRVSGSACRRRTQPLLRRDALAGVTTGYALRLDADTHIGPDLERMIAAVIASDVDLGSVKVEAENRTTVATKLQALEYWMAMLSRHFRPWMTSGACFIGKTDAPATHLRPALPLDSRRGARDRTCRARAEAEDPACRLRGHDGGSGDVCPHSSASGACGGPDRSGTAL